VRSAGRTVILLYERSAEKHEISIKISIVCVSIMNVNFILCVSIDIF
jgi:hypothetical protein